MLAKARSSLNSVPRIMYSRINSLLGLCIIPSGAPGCQVLDSRSGLGPARKRGVDHMTKGRALDSYELLGRSGLRVSPLALGAMTFGTDWGWGADASDARRIFDTYVDRGGNFIDTANQ